MQVLTHELVAAVLCGNRYPEPGAIMRAWVALGSNRNCWKRFSRMEH
jgi:hypothetical protein